MTPIIADAAPALSRRSVSGPIGDEDGDGEAVADLRPLSPGLDAEPVVGQRGGEQLADPVGVTRLGERAAEQPFELAFQAVVGHARLAEPDVAEGLLQLTGRQRPDVRWIAQPLHGVEGVGLVRRWSAVGNDDLAASAPAPDKADAFN